VTGFHVDTAALRSAAGQVRTVGSGVVNSAGAVPGSVAAGTSVNPGFATSAALEAFANQLATSMRTAGGSVDDHAGKLSACADRYDANEADTASTFTG
jgi:hypothetical protein